MARVSLLPRRSSYLAFFVPFSLSCSISSTNSLAFSRRTCQVYHLFPNSRPFESLSSSLSCSSNLSKKLNPRVALLKLLPRERMTMKMKGSQNIYEHLPEHVGIFWPVKSAFSPILTGVRVSLRSRKKYAYLFLGVPLRSRKKIRLSLFSRIRADNVKIWFNFRCLCYHASRTCDVSIIPRDRRYITWHR